MSSPISKTRLCLLASQQAYLLQTPVPNSLTASKSFVLSLAQFLCSEAKLHPESILVSELQESAQLKDAVRLLQEPEYYVEIWCDLLFSLLCQDRIMQVEEEGVIIAPVSQRYLEYAIQSGLFIQLHGYKMEANIKTTISSQVYSSEWEPTPKDELKRIMVINLSQSVTNVDKTRPKINLDGLFSGLYYRKGDIWTSYKILLKEIPTIEEMIQSDTILISGSTYSVNNMHEYMKLFVANLVVALDLNKKLKVAGGCFGHQLLAQAHGARIEKRQLTRGPEIVTLKPHNLGEVSYLSELCSGEPLELKPYEFHSDYVVNLPSGFVCVAESESCENEVFVSQDKRIFSFQFHPEYLVQYIRWIEQRWSGKNSSYQGIHQDSYSKDEVHHASSQTFRRAIRGFIDYQVAN